MLKSREMSKIEASQVAEQCASGHGIPFVVDLIKSSRSLTFLRLEGVREVFFVEIKHVINALQQSESLCFLSLDLPLFDLYTTQSSSFVSLVQTNVQVMDVVGSSKISGLPEIVEMNADRHANSVRMAFFSLISRRVFEIEPYLVEVISNNIRSLSRVWMNQVF
eukprot:TRINITY_DN27129_c0_g1_i3.p1 TRINITY_DN27129_c0_g1~~TRINITY_DN27129_c0_g1_i3.p1  ORF type:complete len:164 (+),score=41.01 TRINITY_DN27129_c0_g1_i3:206-697(+)